MESKVFLPIRVSTLRGDQQIPFDAYVRVAGKYILYCRQGDSFEGERLLRLRKKNLKQMFISKEDEPNYRGYLEANLNMAFDQSQNKPVEIRAQILQGAQQAAAEDLMENPADKGVYDVAKVGAEKYVEFVLREDQSLKAILSIPNPDLSISQHGVAVATLAINLAVELGFKESSQLHLLTLGCLLHDIEHYHSGLNVNRPISTFTPPEIDLYHKHPMAGADRLRTSTFVDQIVLRVIAQHEEAVNGSGFPQGLRESEMEPMAIIAAAANAYDRAISFEGLTARDAVKHVLVQKMGAIPLGHLQALQRVLKNQFLG